MQSEDLKTTLNRDEIFYHEGLIAGLRRARSLAADGLHVDPSTTLQDFLIAIDAILAEEDPWKVTRD